MTTPSFFNCQCIFKAHFPVFFLIAITFSLIAIQVSFGCVFGSVDLGSSALSPSFLYTDTHLSTLRLPYGQTLAMAFSLICLLMTGRTHLKLSSLIVLSIHMLISP